MTTSDERLAELLQLALAAGVEPVGEPEELARRSVRAHLETVGLPLGPELPEVAVRLHGPGVSGHDIPVREAAGILTALQETVASIGQVLSHRATASGPINAQVLRATELRISPVPRPGSVIFHLTGPGESVSGDEATALLGNDTLVDSVMRELFTLVERSADADKPETAGSLARELRRFGPRVAKHLDELAGHVVKDEIDMDLNWRTPRGERHHAALERRTAQIIRSAIKMNEVESRRVRLNGILITVSTAKKAELRTLDRHILKLAVDDQLAASLGPFYNKQVVVLAEETVKWSTDTGRETRSYRMLSIELDEHEHDSEQPAPPATGA